MLSGEKPVSPRARAVLCELQAREGEGSWYAEQPAEVNEVSGSLSDGVERW